MWVRNSPIPLNSALVGGQPPLRRARLADNLNAFPFMILEPVLYGQGDALSVRLAGLYALSLEDGLRYLRRRYRPCGR